MHLSEVVYIYYTLRLDYGCIVYAQASEAGLRILKTIKSCGPEIASDAFYSSPGGMGGGVAKQEDFGEESGEGSNEKWEEERVGKGRKERGKKK